MKPLKRLFLVVFFIASALNASVQEAEKAYQDKQYSKAILLYEDALRQAPDHAGLMYNLGNAYAKDKQIGRAIAMFLQAQRWMPRDEDINANLDIVRAQVVDETKPAQAPLFDNVIKAINSVSLNEYMGLGLTLLIALNILLILRFKKKWPVLVKQVFLVWMVVLISFLPFFITKAKLNAKQTSGVIIQKKVVVKSGPSETLPTLFYIHEGVEFSIRQVVNDWSEIQLQNGYNGWISNSTYLSF